LKLHEWLSENGCGLDDRNKDAFASGMPNRIPKWMSLKADLVKSRKPFEPAVHDFRK
jgi:hypothetical protein